MSRSGAARERAPGAATAHIPAQEPVGHVFPADWLLSLWEYLTGVNAVAATYGLDRQLIALVWIVGFSAYFTEDALTRASEALRAETRAISKALGGD